MKLKRLIVIFLGLMFFQYLDAQSVYCLKGKIVDKQNNKVVAFATISIKNKVKGCVSNDDGCFEIVLENKKQQIIISHINYKEKEILLQDSMFSKDSENVFYLNLKSNKLDHILISAGLYEQDMYKLTKSTEVISQHQVKEQLYSNMTDMLASVPGFNQVWEYHSPIILRGLNSNRLVIMKNGSRRIGTFPGGYFGQDMNIYENKKVEIIKGPGSVIYGSGAISGIINVISAEPYGKNNDKVKFLTAFGSNNNEFLELGSLCHKRKNYGIIVNTKYRKTAEMVYGNGEKAENSAVEDRDISINTGYKFSDKHSLLFNANYHYGDWGKARGFNGPTKYFTQINNKEENCHADISYEYKSKGIFEKVKLNVFYDDGCRDYYQRRYSTISGDLSSMDLVHYNSKYGGGRFFAIINLFKNNKLTTGIDAYKFRLDNPTDFFDYYNDIQGVIEGYTNAGQENLGAFVNDAWKLNKKWKIESGIRFDIAKVTEGEASFGTDGNEQRNAFSGNGGLVYSPFEKMNFSFNAGRAFRMPTAEELFTKVISCKGVKIGNPDLKPEYSWNFDLGMRGFALKKQKLKYDVALFYNILTDFINESPVPSDVDVDFSYTNTNAKLLGGELSASYRFSEIFKKTNSLYVGVGASYVYGIDLAGEDNAPLFGMPPFKLTTQLNYRGFVSKKILTSYQLKFESEYAAEQNRIASIPEGTEGGPWGYIPSEAHYVFNCSLMLNSTALPSEPKLRFIIKNIFNEDYQPFGSYISAMGRNFKIALSFTL